MQVTLDINGRAALPLRAIPYVTSWNESPDSIVRVLAAPKISKFKSGLEIRNRHNELLAYQIDALGNVAQVQPSQWEPLSVTFDSLTKKFKANEREGAEDENYAPWRIKAVLELPANVFVWQDEFQVWYSLTRPLFIPQDDGRERLDLEPVQSDEDDEGTNDYERQDGSLCLMPIFPPEIENRVWRYAEGFVSAEPDGLERVIIHHHHQVCATEVDRAGLPPAAVEQAPPARPTPDTPAALGNLTAFVSMSKLTAAELSIAFVGDKPEPKSDVGANNFLEISARGVTRRVALATLALVNRQRGGLNGEGVILLAFVGNKKPPGTTANTAKVARLRKIFRTYLGIESDPFYPKAAGWEPRFTIEDKRGEAYERIKLEAERYKTDSYEQRNERGEKAGDTNQSHQSSEEEYSFYDEYEKGDENPLTEKADEFLRNN